ncbi:MAG: hypothetical protein HC849_32535 [Oscillatoriales cyanobacterium RU_3_3]|nr:hypothetical protein [Microcoleus sp. SU_5_6]NJL68873.1 hypothetical protein [Microcoleus sp. SM1_3_4]NJM63810.1 hypothetical protein [Oscillatoriales cyanobacterium RU_3_3]NJR23014.1 hypothetical protein [Richelia sp. CSU_2_1]
MQRALPLLVMSGAPLQKFGCKNSEYQQIYNSGAPYRNESTQNLAGASVRQLYLKLTRRT